MLRSELDSLFRDLLAANRGPGYAVSVLDSRPDLSFIDVSLRFLAGRRYCCTEPGCHLPVDTEQHRLRRLARDRGIVLPRSLTIRWHVHVEAGVQYDRRHGDAAPDEPKPYQYVVTYGSEVRRD